jgi:hypothetical protein
MTILQSVFTLRDGPGGRDCVMEEREIDVSMSLRNGRLKVYGQRPEVERECFQKIIYRHRIDRIEDALAGVERACFQQVIYHHPLLEKHVRH